jgi:hypothetical protein
MDEVFEQLRGELKQAGWKEQTAGPIYINGEVATNLYHKDYGLLHLSINSMPDEEVIEDMFEEGLV